ncbi:tRNA-specific adenosine deaminase [Persicimonas caeni]|uniref:hypothetical protein n=1 Tax=Persicimonas caeni TaxID=2292766 RepID=UPI00143D3E71|nr:hypothetical protein [Persicimonas caeni]
MPITLTDQDHLRRCIEVASEAVERGDDPFGSLLVVGDVTAHPELALASSASRHLSAEERAQATMCTSGVHCAMSAPKHVASAVIFPFLCGV